MTERTKLAVLGSPIAHSLSPRLHRAAYEVLGLAWTYDAVEVRSGGLDEFLEGLDDGWRGLSLTMPLKREAGESASTPVPDDVRQTGSANTLVLRPEGLSAFNTDIHGIIAALQTSDRLSDVHLLGAGATAASALVAVQRLGAVRVHILARTPARAQPLELLGRALELTVTIGDLETAPPWPADVAISTLPGGTPVVPALLTGITSGATLLDVAYDPWPSELAERWSSAGGRVVSGIEMLVHQAVAQIRLFVHDDADRPLVDEPRVVAAMRSAVLLG